MNSIEQKEQIKLFFLTWPYRVMHEEDIKSDVEHFFVVIDKNDLKTRLMESFFDTYIEKYPLINVSPQTQEYMDDHKSLFYFVLIDSVKHNDPFFEEKAHFIKNNSNNIICLKSLGEVADLTSHMENHMDKYLDQAKSIGFSLKIVTEDKLRTGLNKGKQLISEKTPLVKKRLFDFKDKIEESLNGNSKRKNKP